VKVRKSFAARLPYVARKSTRSVLLARRSIAIARLWQPIICTASIPSVSLRGWIPAASAATVLYFVATSPPSEVSAD
jgi:hypothetical protein